MKLEALDSATFVALFGQATWNVLLELAPSLLLGLLIAGLLHVYLPSDWVQKRLARKGLRSVLSAVALGVPLPLCSCGVVPAAISLRQGGASKGAATGFLISTPQTGVDSIVVSASFLGLPFAIFKVIAAFVTGVVGGVLVDVTTPRDEPPEPPPTTCAASRGRRRLSDVPRYAIGELLAMIDIWIAVGVLVSALIATLIPPGALAGQAWASGIVGMLVVLAISLPLYVCATSSVPIAASLIAAGMPMGSALVFLMAGPASNAATMGAVYRGFGARVAAIYIAVVALLSMAFGLLFDFVLPQSAATHAGHAHEHATFLSTASALVLLGLLGTLYARRIATALRRLRHQKGMAMERTLEVQGMTCKNCASHVERALRAVSGVQDVVVELAQGAVKVKGDAESSALVAAITAAGYSVVKGA
ncbi:MAG: permease [Myxococcota bacterium]|nr:permease [Myxococcota bacterium]